MLPTEQITYTHPNQFPVKRTTINSRINTRKAERPRISRGLRERENINFSLLERSNKKRNNEFERPPSFPGTSGLASDPARLTQARIDGFSDKSDVHLRVQAGNNVPITCPVPYSVPEAIIQFFKDDKPIQNASLTGSKIMIIERARATDSGYYHCQTYNYITSEQYTSNHRTVLTVDENTTDQAPYSIKQPQHEYKLQRGKNVTLECFAVGYPVPQVRTPIYIDATLRDYI